MNYGEYRSARELCKAEGLWFKAFDVAAAMPEGDEREMAMRDWWMSSPQIAMSPSDVKIFRDKQLSGWMGYGHPTISHLIMIEDECEIRYRDVTMFKGADVELPKIAQKFGQTMVSRLFESFEQDIQDDELLEQIVIRYKDVVKTSKGSKERSALITTISEDYLSLRWDSAVDRLRADTLSELIARSMLACLLEYEHYLEGIAFSYQSAYNLSRRCEGYQDNFEIVDDLAGEYMTIILQTYRSKLR